MSKKLVLIVISIAVLSIFSGLFFFTKKGSVPVPDTVINDGIPDIPKKIKSKMDPYMENSANYFLDWDPSGKRMIVKANLENTSQIYMLNEPMGKLEKLTDFNQPVSDAISCPDPEKNYFIYLKDIDGDEKYQFYRYSIQEGTDTLITDGINRHVRPRFNHCGNKIAYSSNARTGILEDIYVMDPENPAEAKIVFKSQRPAYLYPFGWFYDDCKLLVLEVISINEANTYIVDTETAEVNQLNNDSESTCFYGMIYPSIQGNYVIGRTDCLGEYQQLAKRDLKNNVTDILAMKINWDTEDIAVAGDFSIIAFIANEGGVDRLYLMNPVTFRYKKAESIPDGQISGMTFNKTGEKLAMTISNQQMSGDIYVYNTETGNTTRWTNNMQGRLNTSGFVKPVLIQYPTFDSIKCENRHIPAFYYVPEIIGRKPHPVIIFIHGGPEGQFVPDYNTLINFWTNELGAAVIAPNVRGSSGYGKSYLLLDNEKRRENAVHDIGALLNWISSRPELDNKKIAVYGASYGGYMVLSTMFHYGDRIACGVDIVGISNFNTFLQNTSPYRVDFRREEYGDEREISEFLNQISPLSHAHRIVSPLLVIQGKNDARVPWTEAEQIVKTIRKNNVVVWYQLLTNEGHVFLKKDNMDYVNYCVVEFFNRYLLN